MATSSVEICNSAILKVGAERIDDLSDDTPAAIACNDQYARCRDDVLRAHPWNFAIERAELAADADGPADDSYAYRYSLPSNCLRVLTVNVDDNNAIWKVEGRFILSDDTEMFIKFIKQQTDTTKFDKNFEEVLALRIASDICFKLTGNAALQKQLYDAYKDALRAARSYDAQEGSSDSVVSDDWFVSRF